MNSIQPGAQVHDQEGLIGVVEQAAAQGRSGGDANSSLIVREAQSGRRYSFPLRLVSSIREAEGQQLIQLDLARTALPDFRIEGPSARAVSPLGESTADAAGEARTISVPLASEELVTEIRPTERGHISIHKGVEHVERSVEVPIQMDDVEIEHLAPDQYDPNTPTQPDEWVIPVHEERLLVRKQTVVKEYLRIRKRRITQQLPVRDTLRSEYLEVSERGPDGQSLESGSLLHEVTPDPAAPDLR